MTMVQRQISTCLTLNKQFLALSTKFSTRISERSNNGCCYHMSSVCGWMDHVGRPNSGSHTFSTLPNHDDDTTIDQLDDMITTTNDSNHVHPWFPTHRSEIDRIIYRTIQATTLNVTNDDGYDENSTLTKDTPDNVEKNNNMITSLSSDHPGFRDPVYRQRRTILAQYAQQYQWDQNEHIPVIHYTPSETKVWTKVYDQMVPLIQQYACHEYQNEFQQMEQCGLYTRTQIPQQSQIYPYLYDKTQFRLRPVAGLLQSRDFLNALALRIFCSTQYIRHESQPYYTPEPDICHELLGHVPLLGHPTFAHLSQQIGLASLGASDDDIQQLAKCYWHSVEFGLCYENGTTEKKAYGAGLLSSFGELEYSCGGGGSGGGSGGSSTLLSSPTYLPWDPYHAAHQEFPVTTYQPIYYVADSILDALEKLKLFCDTHLEPKKSYSVSYNPMTERIDVTMK